MDSSIFLLRQYGLIDTKSEHNTSLKPYVPSESTIMSSSVPTLMNAIWLKRSTFFNENLHSRWDQVYRCGVYDKEGNLLLTTNKIWSTFKHTGFPPLEIRDDKSVVKRMVFKIVSSQEDQEKFEVDLLHVIGELN